MITKTFSRFILGVLIMTMLSPFAFAESASVGVRPLRTEVSIKPGETKTAILEVINRNEKETVFEAVLEPITAADEAGYPIIGAESNLAPEQNVVSWIKFAEEKQVTVPGNDKKSVEIFITAPANAEPGGHYAAIYYQPIISEEKNVQGVKIQTRVASLILVTVEGAINKEGELTSFSLNKELYFDQPINFNVSFKNTGTIHLKPQGRITLFDENNNQIMNIARYKDSQTNEEKVTNFIPVNLNRGNVIPNTERTFEAKWSEGYQKQVGKFIAKLHFEYADKKIDQELPFEIKPSIQVSALNFNQAKKEFTVKLTNTGNLIYKPSAKIKIFNSMDFQIDELSIISEENLIPGTEKEFVVLWSKEAPSDKYTASVDLGAFVIDSKQNAEKIVKIDLLKGIWRYLLSDDTKQIRITTGSLIFLVIIGGAWFFIHGRKKVNSRKK